MLGRWHGEDGPTYIYPIELQRVVRARHPGEVKEWAEPEGPEV